jgi:hypothetical protein
LLFRVVVAVEVVLMRDGPRVVAVQADFCNLLLFWLSVLYTQLPWAQVVRGARLALMVQTDQILFLGRCHQLAVVAVRADQGQLGLQVDRVVVLITQLLAVLVLLVRVKMAVQE